MTKVLRLHGQGLANLQLDEVTLRQPGFNEVKVKIKASALNRDQMRLINGTVYAGEGEQAQELSQLGYEGAGIVTAVGPDVDKKWLGKEVGIIGPYDVAQYGTEGTETLALADRLVAKSPQLTWAQEAALWVPYLTAYAIIADGHLKAGEYVLIPAATSMVGQAAAQIARRIGAYPIGLSRSDEGVKELRTLGMKYAANSSDDGALVQYVNTVTSGHGVDVVFDALAGQFVSTAAQVSAQDGRIITYGVMGGLAAQLPLNEMMPKALTIKAFTVNEVITNQVKLAAAKHFILSGVNDGSLVPPIAATYPLADYQKAYAELQGSHKTGRIVLVND